MIPCLLHRVATGDPTAVDECIDRFGGLIWSIARRFLRNAADAEDAVQEVFVALWQVADRYDPSVASETVFVTTIARRRLIDRKRRATVRAGVAGGAIDENAVGMIDAGLSRAELSDEAALAAAALGQLGPEQRRVILLSVHEGWSHSRIAEHLKLPLGTVKTHVRRGLAKIREILEDNRTADAKGVAI